MAAGRTVSAPFVCHSLHVYFLAPGDIKLPIIYQVDRTLEGKSFANRRVVALQKGWLDCLCKSGYCRGLILSFHSVVWGEGRAIATISVSFQLPEEGFKHMAKMPNAPDPTTLTPLRQQLVEASNDPTLPERAR